MRPDRLFVVRPQEKIQRHTVDQICRRRFSDARRKLVASLLHYDTPIPDQVIAVPKISSPTCCSRTVLSEPQMAELLVEAPSLVSLVDVFEQTVDIPVGAGGFSGNGGLQKLLPGHSSSPTVEQIVDSLVPPPSGFGGLQGVHQDSSTAVAEQNVDIPVPRGGLQIKVPQRFFQIFVETQFQGGFRTFLRRKKGAPIASQLGSQLGADSSSSTPAAHHDDFWVDEAGGLWMRLPSGRWTLLGSDEHVFWDEPSEGSYGLLGDRWGATASSCWVEASVALASVRLFLIFPLTQWYAGQMLVVAEPGSAISLRRLPEESFFLHCVAARAVSTWKKGTLFPLRPCIMQSCLGVACGVQGIGFGR